jgi:hypothetical protein
VGGRGLDTFFYTCRPPTRTTQGKNKKEKRPVPTTGVVAGGVVIRGARERTGKNDTHITIIEREREKRIIFKEKKKMMIINK